MTQSPLLALDAIDHTYTEDQLILKSISFGVEQGELLGILGPSGCGKTTLLRLIAGFERPSQGRIQLANRVVCGRRAWIPAEQRQVGMVFQDYALFPHLSVAKNIAFGLRQPAAATRQRVAEVLNLVDLAGLEERYPHQLSGGQQQRVALARALAPAPKLILLDEPLSNLDVQVRVQLRYDLRDILKRAHTAGLLVTHDQEEALSICDRIVVMRQGYVEQIDTPEGIYKQPRSRFVAEFVAQANFVPAVWRGGQWQTEVGQFEAVDGFDGSGGRAAVMVRQEDVTLVTDEQGAGVIDDRQFLGREHRYRVRLPSNQRLVARLPDTVALPVGARVRVSADPGAVRLFPPAMSP